MGVEMRKWNHFDGACDTFLRVADGESVDDALQNQFGHGAVVGQYACDLFESGGVVGLVFENRANKVGMVGQKLLGKFFFKLVNAEDAFSKLVAFLGDFCFVHLFKI